MLNKIKLGQKLIGSFLIVSLIAAVIGIIGIVNMKKIDDADLMLYKKMTMPISNLLKITESFQRIRINVRDLADATNAADRTTFSNTINDLSKVTVDNAAIFEKTILTDEGRKIFKDFSEARQIYHGHLDDVINLVKQEKIKEARDIIEGVGKTSALAEQATIDKLVESKLGLAKETSDNNTKAASFSVMIMTTVIIIGVILAIILGLILTGSITRAVGGEPAEIANIADRVSKGDMEINFESNFKKINRYFFKHQRND